PKSNAAMASKCLAGNRGPFAPRMGGRNAERQTGSRGPRADVRDQSLDVEEPRNTRNTRKDGGQGARWKTDHGPPACAKAFFSCISCISWFETSNIEHRTTINEQPTTAWSGQVGGAHEVAVALARGAAALVEGPDHQALAAPTIARREHLRDAGLIAAVLGLD